MDIPLKMDVEDNKDNIDYTTACDEVIPLAKELAKVPIKFFEAIEILLQLEKKCRLACDTPSCSRVLIAIVEICFESNRWNSLNEYIALLVKRRNQLKSSISKMIQECVIYVEKIPDEDIQLKLINTLRNVCEGKIYVENERARLTKQLSRIMENNGDITNATKVMEELQVETYSQMSRREKVQFTLEQMRLNLALNDQERAKILSKKINYKFFDDPEQKDLKLIYYNLMIEINRDNAYLETSKHYQALFQANENNDKLMKFAVLYCILAPYSNEQKNMMLNLTKNKFIKYLPRFKEILECFLRNELINVEQYMENFRSEFFKPEIWNQRTKHGKYSYIEMKHRLIEHNIRIISMYYKRIYLNRLSELITLPKRKCESYLSKLCVDNVIRVKIDRITGIVDFVFTKTSSEILNDWSRKIGELVQLVNTTSTLVTYEICINHALLLSIDEPED